MFGVIMRNPEICRLVLERILGIKDEATRIFMNTKGRKDDVSGHVKRFLRFIDSGANPEPEDPLLCMMNEKLQKVRNDEDRRREYMTLFLRDQENIEKERQEGLKEGRQEGHRNVIEKMLKNGMAAEQIAMVTETSLEEVKKIAEALPAAK